MARKVTKRLSKAIDAKSDEVVEFDLADVVGVSSSTVFPSGAAAVQVTGGSRG